MGKVGDWVVPTVRCYESFVLSWRWQTPPVQGVCCFVDQGEVGDGKGEIARYNFRSS